MTHPNPTQTTSRRSTIVSAGAVTATALTPSIATAATSSGEAELSVTASVPADTSVTITVAEYLAGGDGFIDNSHEVTVSDGTNTYVLDSLQGGDNDGHSYSLYLDLSTTDSAVTPTVDAATITLPTEGIAPIDDDDGTGDDTTDAVAGEQQGIRDLWDNFLVNVTISVIVMGLIGLASRSMAIASLSAYLLFAYIAVETGNVLLTNILYVTVVLVIVGMALKLWRLEGTGEA